MGKIKFWLYAVIGQYTGRRKLEWITEELCKAQVNVIQLRLKNVTQRQFYEKAVKVKEICTKYKTPLIINDRIDICLAVNADGVHLGEKDIPPDVARKILGKEKIIGLTVRSLETALKYKDFVDYFSVGNIFPSKTKPKPPVSPQFVKEIKEKTGKICLGIGGITLENVDRALSYGIDGVCIAKDLLDRENIREHAEKLLMRILHYLSQRG